LSWVYPCAIIEIASDFSSLQFTYEFEEDPIMHKKLLFVSIILILVLTACSGGTSGSVSGSQQNCREGGGEVICDGRINQLSGTYNFEVETGYFNEGDPVLVEAYFITTIGSMKVSVEAPDGSLTEAEVVPGEIGVLLGLGTVESAIDENAVPITLHAVDGDVEGITFEIYLTQP
jgi:hypothetical protein